MCIYKILFADIVADYIKICIDSRVLLWYMHSAD